MRSEDLHVCGQIFKASTIQCSLHMFWARVHLLVVAIYFVCWFVVVYRMDIALWQCATWPEFKQVSLFNHIFYADCIYYLNRYLSLSMFLASGHYRQKCWVTLFVFFSPRPYLFFFHTPVFLIIPLSDSLEQAGVISASTLDVDEAYVVCC